MPTSTTQYPQATGLPGLATQPQINFICDLMDQKNLFADPSFFDRVNAMDKDEYAAYLRFIKSRLPHISKRKASDTIESLKKLPREEQPAPANVAQGDRRTLAPLQGWRPMNVADEGEVPVWAMHPGTEATDPPIVPRGSYAVRGGNYANEINFYSVWISDDGSRWTVRKYESDERVRIPRTRQNEVLDIIARDPASAASLYGHEIGRCGICSKKLTNDESRERGIGPVCAERWGW